MEASYGRVNPLILNQDLLELIKMDSKEANERIGKTGSYRWQEENKRLGSILAEGVDNFAYGVFWRALFPVFIVAISYNQHCMFMRFYRIAIHY